MSQNPTPRPSRQQLAWILLGVGGGILAARAVESVYQRVATFGIVILTGVFLAVAIDPLVTWLEHRGVRRGFGAFLVLVSSAAALVALVATSGAVAVTQGAHLIDDLPNLAAQLQDRLATWGVNVDLVSLVRDRDRLDTLAQDLRANAVQLSSHAVGGIVKGVGAMFVAFWVCVDGPKLRHLIAKRVPLESRHHVETVWDTAVERTGGYLLSRVILGAVGAGFFSSAFVVIGIPYAVPFGIWAGFVAMVPLVGSWMGILLPVALTLGQNPTKALLALGAFWALQYVKNLFVVPRVTRKTVNVHPLVSFSAVVIGAALAGGIGALLALPLTASAIGIVSAIEADRAGGAQSTPDDKPRPARRHRRAAARTER